MKKLLILLAYFAVCFSSQAQATYTIADSGYLDISASNTDIKFNHGSPNIQLLGSTVTFNDGVNSYPFNFTQINTIPAFPNAAAFESYCQNIVNEYATNGTTLINVDSTGNTKDSVKGSPGVLYGYSIYNPNSYAVYVQFYNKPASGVTVNTTAPLFVEGCAATSGRSVHPIKPVRFSAGITTAIAKTPHGYGAPASTVQVTLYYR